MSELTKTEQDIAPTDWEYFEDWEVTRDMGEVNRNFVKTFGSFENPIHDAIKIIKEQGCVAILDAGCGSGYALFDYKEHVSLQSQIDAQNIIAVGIDRHDYSQHLNERLQGEVWEKKKQVADGYMDIRLGDLAKDPIEPESFDVAYAYEVLIYNENIDDIVANILSSLKPGGVFYCNTRTEQGQAFDDFAQQRQTEGWIINSSTLNREAFMGAPADSRVFHKFTKPV